MKFRVVGPYRLFFTSNDRDEPPHIHIEREGMVAKFWLKPVRLVESPSEIMKAWNELHRR